MFGKENASDSHDAVARLVERAGQARLECPDDFEVVVLMSRRIYEVSTPHLEDGAFMGGVPVVTGLFVDSTYGTGVGLVLRVPHAALDPDGRVLGFTSALLVDIPQQALMDVVRREFASSQGAEILARLTYAQQLNGLHVMVQGAARVAKRLREGDEAARAEFADSSRSLREAEARAQGALDALRVGFAGTEIPEAS